MSCDLEEQIHDALKDRQEWESKQAVFSKMRNGGLRRINKPYLGAPDTHVPLIDATIDKQKPFYLQQIYGTETAASFTALTADSTESANAVGAWFDYCLKQKSNFERESISAIDTLLESGGAPVKTYWSERKGRVEFDACDPLHVIVPKWTEELQTADFLVHVLPMSEAQYRRNPLFLKDDDFVKSIKGKGNGSRNDGDSSGKQQDMYQRAGLTHSDDEQIIVWEIYTRSEEDFNRIIVKTRSPIRFDEEIRADFELPYTEGVFKEGWFPFVKWRMEIKNKGYYMPRGVAEIQASSEATLCKTQNFKMEWMDFFARPMFQRGPNYSGNTSNFKSHPGAIVPDGLIAVKHEPMPEGLDREMNLTREWAEYRLQTPDFGVLQQNGGKRTAHEVEAISQQTGQGTDMRARIFRLDLGDTYRMKWALDLQYGKDALNYVLHGEAKQLDASALADNYEVTPNGSADSWNKAAVMQRASNRFDKLRGDPYIKQGPLREDLLSADQAGLVKRLYQEPEDAQADEAEEQAEEIGVMMLGFPAHVDPTDADVVHIVTGCQWVEQTLKNQEPIEPRMARLLTKHFADHTNSAMQKKDPQIKQVNQQYAHIVQILSQIAAQPDPREIAAAQAQQAASNILPMQQGAGSMPAAGAGTAPVASEQPQGVMQ